MLETRFPTNTRIELLESQLLLMESSNAPDYKPLKGPVVEYAPEYAFPWVVYPAANTVGKTCSNVREAARHIRDCWPLEDQLQLLIYRFEAI